MLNPAALPALTDTAEAAATTITEDTVWQAGPVVTDGHALPGLTLEDLPF